MNPETACIFVLLCLAIHQGRINCEESTLHGHSLTIQRNDFRKKNGIENSVQGHCRNILFDSKCQQLRMNNECYTKRQKMERLCPKTCNLCPQCNDILPIARCKQLKSHYACLKQHDRMKHYCPKTCRFCPVQNCTDTHPNCDEWSRNGGCDLNKEDFARRCPRSCGLCGPRTPCDNIKCPRGQKCLLDSKGSPFCSCAIKCKREKYTGPLCGTNGKTYDNLCDLLQDECEIGDFITVKHFGQCIKYEPCEDNADPGGSSNNICAGMKESGACSTHKELMQFYCAKTCRLCRQLAPSPSCSSSKFGCCWNKDIPATGKYAQGCGGCKDIALCNYFGTFCGEGKNVNFMRKYCPALCHYCIPEYKVKRGYR